jgi:hypothetical protein
LRGVSKDGVKPLSFTFNQILSTLSAAHVGGKHPPQFPPELNSCPKENFCMRIANAIIAGSFAALLALALPALAKNSDVPKPDDKSVSSPCHAYEQTADGEWKPIPCQESGSQARTQQGRSSASSGSPNEASH